MGVMLAAMVLVLHAQDAPLSPAQEDIVVVGELMRRTKFVTKTDRNTGVTRCLFKRRSGDAAFDALMCDAVLTCAKTVTTRPQMEACIGPRIDAYGRDVTARRKAARPNPD